METGACICLFISLLLSQWIVEDASFFRSSYKPGTIYASFELYGLPKGEELVVVHLGWGVYNTHKNTSNFEKKPFNRFFSWSKYFFLAFLFYGKLFLNGFKSSSFPYKGKKGGPLVGHYVMHFFYLCGIMCLGDSLMWFDVTHFISYFFFKCWMTNVHVLVTHCTNTLTIIGPCFTIGSSLL